MNVNKETMLRRLQAADFVLHETVLYLDGHPTNQKALEFFRKAKAAYDELLAEFQEAFGQADGLCRRRQQSLGMGTGKLAVAERYAGRRKEVNAYVGL